MAIDGLKIVGESINDSVPSTQKLFNADDIDGLKDLAKFQDERGALYIDVNIGQRSASFLADMVKDVQSVTSKPLSIDTPDPEMAAVGLEAYDVECAGGKLPILNSVSQLRMEMFDLYKVQPFMPMLMVSERTENGKALPNQTAEETYKTACEMRQSAAELGINNDQMIVDHGIAPIGADSEGIFHRLMDAMQMFHDDKQFDGIYYSVVLSNLTVILPIKRPDGIAIKSSLESAFLTLAMLLGLDMVIVSVNRKYEVLPKDHPAMVCLDDVLKLEGFDAILRVQEFYS